MSELISRQAAIDYFVTNVGFNDEDGYPIEDECELRRIWTDIIEGIPPEPDAISRQAAIDALKELTANGTNKGMVFGEDAGHRIEMLPPAQPEPCEDAVSRADILSMIDDMADDVNDGFGFAYEQWKEQAEELPPVTPKQRTGKWERHYSRPNVYADLCWHCSACGYYHADNWTNKFKYCPNCGAKMEGANNESD